MWLMREENCTTLYKLPPSLNWLIIAGSPMLLEMVLKAESHLEKVVVSISTISSTLKTHNILPSSGSNL